jgi:hypothetical protein
MPFALIALFGFWPAKFGTVISGANRATRESGPIASNVFHNLSLY